VRRVFDLAADPSVIDAWLCKDAAKSIAALHLHPSDVFNTKDALLREALARLTGTRDEQQWLRRAAPWRPWRAYAAAHLLAAPDLRPARENTASPERIAV
jgi:AraC family transcriptional regulator of adaptative response / DNA-3-methyladenine glycosylase II